MSKKRQNLPVKPIISKPIQKEVPTSSKDRYYILFILFISFLVLSPSIKNEFVNWDDDRNVYENPYVSELNKNNVKAIFTHDVIGNYNPLTILTFAIEKHFTKEFKPHVMHFNNLLLHLLCVFLVFYIFRSLGLTLLFASLGALLFGIHPMRVESVAWITERKDVLFASFFLSALYLYIKNLDQQKSSRTFWIFILFVLGLFAKIQMVALPLSMLAVDYWKNRPLGWNLITEKWFYFLGALCFGLLGIYMLDKQGSLESAAVHSGVLRLFIGSFSFIVYLIKWIFPYELLPLYPYPENITVWHYLSFPVALAILYICYWAFKKNYRAFVFGMAFFLFNIVFLLQILGAGQGYIADRFTYIAYIGLFFICCYYVQQYVETHATQKTMVLTGFGCYLAIFGIMSYKQCGIWKDSGTLWTRVIEFYDNTPLPFNNRANHLRDLKQYDAALKDYSRAIELKAGHATYNSRAKLFFIRNEDQKAILDYNKAIEMNPMAEYYVNRGAANAKLGNLPNALSDLTKGLELDPTWKVGYLNRSIVYNQQGQYDLALGDLDKYLKYDPKNADIWYEGGRCHRALNNPTKAIEYYSRAIQFNPNSGLYYLERGKTYIALGQQAAGKTDLTKAQQLGEKVDFNLLQ
jgi:tetratricopeptide (TPR) repeat protein